MDCFLASSSHRSGEANSARIEGDSVDWLLAMPGSVSATLAVPPGAQGGYTTSAATDAGISPALTVQELTGLVSAYAVSADFHAGAKDPAANHQRLIAGELARLRAEVAAGASDAELATAVERIGYLDGVASGALIELAQQQDAVNRSMWETIAEAKNGTLGILRGPGATVDVVQSVITQGTTRSALDDAVITRIRSDLAAEQAEANQARGAALARALSAIHVPERAGAGSVEMQLLRGARLAPTAPTVAEIRSARHAELAGHLTDHTYGSADSHTSAAVTRHDQMRVRSGVKGERPTPGTVVVPAGVKPLPHERATAESLAAAGRDVEFIRATTMGRTPDALVDGVRWELKAIKGDGPGTVVQERRRRP